MSHSAFAPGKVILMGEHAVVYGHPALAMAVNRGMTVTLRERAGATAIEDGDVSDVRLERALAEVLPSDGWGVQIASDLPVGRGMGSSAALAVALARASASALGHPSTPSHIEKVAASIEQIFHGTPSGVDQTVCTRGGAIRFQRTPEGARYQSVALPELPIVVIDSGSAGNTGEMVAAVAGRRPAIDPYLQQIGDLLNETWPALMAGDLAAIGQAWHENHWLLRAIGVSTPTLDEIVTLATRAGALGAKLAGAGGGGVVIALAPEPQTVIRAAEARGLAAITVRQFSPLV